MQHEGVSLETNDGHFLCLDALALELLNETNHLIPRWLFSLYVESRIHPPSKQFNLSTLTFFFLRETFVRILCKLSGVDAIDWMWKCRILEHSASCSLQGDSLSIRSQVHSLEHEFAQSQGVDTAYIVCNSGIHSHNEIRVCAGNETSVLLQLCLILFDFGIWDEHLRDWWVDEDRVHRLMLILLAAPYSINYLYF